MAPPLSACSCAAVHVPLHQDQINHLRMQLASAVTWGVWGSKGKISGGAKRGKSTIMLPNRDACHYLCGRRTINLNISANLWFILIWQHQIHWWRFPKNGDISMSYPLVWDRSTHARTHTWTIHLLLLLVYVRTWREAMQEEVGWQIVGCWSHWG